MRSLGTVIAVLLSFAGVAGALADVPTLATCEDEARDAAMRIADCSRLLESGTLAEQDRAEAFYGRGLAYDDAGENEKAIQDYDRAIALRADFSEAFANRGVAYDALGNESQAILDYDQAIRLDPGNAEAYNNRAGDYEDRGEYDRANRRSRPCNRARARFRRSV